MDSVYDITIEIYNPSFDSLNHILYTVIDKRTNVQLEVNLKVTERQYEPFEDTQVNITQVDIDINPLLLKLIPGTKFIDILYNEFEGYINNYWSNKDISYLLYDLFQARKLPWINTNPDILTFQCSISTSEYQDIKNSNYNEIIWPYIKPSKLNYKNVTNYIDFNEPINYYQPRSLKELSSMIGINNLKYWDIEQLNINDDLKQNLLMDRIKEISFDYCKSNEYKYDDEINYILYSRDIDIPNTQKQKCQELSFLISRKRKI